MTRGVSFLIDVDDVFTILEHATLRLKLFVMLALNCGFGSGDIGRLKKEDYNPKSGRIYYRRHKTQRHKNVPQVCYLLWDRTKKLLDEVLTDQEKFIEKESSDEYLFRNYNGQPLWRITINENNKVSKIDNIKRQFNRLVKTLKDENIIEKDKTVSFKSFRKLSPSLIRNAKVRKKMNKKIIRKKRFEDSLYRLWLGHASESIADRHYAEAGETILDDCILWLERKIFMQQKHNAQ